MAKVTNVEYAAFRGMADEWSSRVGDLIDCWEEACDWDRTKLTPKELERVEALDTLYSTLAALAD